MGSGLVQFNLHNPSTRPVEISLVPTSGEAQWFFSPEHLHALVPAGESKTFSLTAARVKAGFPADLAVPTLSLEMDYLAEGARVTLPPRTLQIPLGMKTPGPEFFAAPAENKVVEFNGASALRVDLAPTDLPDGAFSIEAWVRPKGTGGHAPFVAKTEQSEFALDLANNIPGFHCFLGGKYVSAIAPTDQALATDTWAHLAGVFDAQEMRLYVNGKLAAKVAANGPRTTNALPLYVGADPDAKSQPTQFFTGAVDEFRLSTKVRYTDNFTPALRLATDAQTLLLFHFDSLVGPFLPSDSAGDRYATRAGTPRFVPAMIP